MEKKRNRKKHITYLRILQCQNYYNLINLPSKVIFNNKITLINRSLKLIKINKIKFIKITL